LIGHIIRHNEFAVNITEGTISGKKAVGRPKTKKVTEIEELTVIRQ
jgi:hypothetical protein